VHGGGTLALVVTAGYGDNGFRGIDIRDRRSGEVLGAGKLSNLDVEQSLTLLTQIDRGSTTQIVELIPRGA
jgi:hypothetical protein